jgi:23S rRNA pseudouridine1911/1915/1917 synthase
VTKYIEIRIPDGTPRTRLEDILFDHFPNLSRMYLREIVRDGKCEVNGRHENVGFRVRGGDFVEIALDPSRETAMRPEDIRLDIIFEDAHLIVVNKPAGMLVHPTHREKTGTLLNALAFYLNAKSRANAERGVRSAEFDGSAIHGLEDKPSFPAFDPTDSALRVPSSAFIRAGLVHRLDKQTSGLMVVAKTVDAHRKLARQFQKKQVEKKYLALVEGVIKSDHGLIEGTIGRYAEQKRWDIKADGKHSTTRYRVMERHADTTLLELEPVTGRTNQLRIHCASIGHPIVGDVARGGRAHERLCLHAWRISFRHPLTNEQHEFERPIRFDREATFGRPRVT